MMRTTLVVSFLALAAVSQTFAKAAGRAEPRKPEVCQKIMEENAYNGEWSYEVIDERFNERLTLVLRKDGRGALFQPAGGLFFTWESEGDGKLNLQLVLSDGSMGTRETITYQPEKDMFDLGKNFKPARVGSGKLKGTLYFRRPDFEPDIERILKRYEGFEANKKIDIEFKKPYERSETLKKLQAANAEGLRQVTSLGDLFNARRLCTNGICISTVDGEYPHLVPCLGKSTELFGYEIYWGCHYADPKARHLIDPDECRPRRKRTEADPPCEIGVPAEKVEELMDELAKIGNLPVRGIVDHGTGKNAWFEEYLSFCVTETEMEEFFKILKKTILSDTSKQRWILEE